MSMLLLTAMAMAVGELPPQQDTLAPPESGHSVVLAQLIIERRTIIRVPPVFTSSPRPQVIIGWKEKSAPKCVSMAALAGLAITKPDAVDLVLRGGQRVRARLEKSCPSVDFYSGFYVKPNKDGRICEDRDTIHSRTGGACEIDKFKSLVAIKAKD
jgi:hypothetical protein